MRKSLVLAALVLIVLFANAQDNLQRGLVAYYPFNDNTNDESGNGNNGTKTNEVVFVDGKFGKAAKFGGNSKPGHIRIPNSSTLKFINEATFAMWVKLDDASGMDGWGKNSATGNHCLFAKDHDRSGIVCTLSYNQNKLSTGLGGYEGVTGGGSCSTLNSGISGYSIGTWVHIVYVCDATENMLYINGEKNNSIAKPFNFGNSNTRDLYFGKFSDSWYPFNGVLDEIRIYNRALNSDEVSKLYKNESLVSVIKNENNEMWSTAIEAVKEHDNQPAIQNKLKLKLPESKYNFSNSKYTELKDYFKGRVIGINLNYMKISDFLNSEFAGNMINGTIIDDFTNFDYSLRLNLIPIFIDVSYFTKSYTYVYWGTSSELKHSGTKFSVSAPFIYVSKLLIPYVGAGYQFSSLKGDVFQNGEVLPSSINTSGTFWKVGIQTYLFKKFPLTVEYNQTLGLNSKNFNQLLLGIGYTY